MSYLADQVVYPIEQSSKLLEIMYQTVNITNNKVGRPLIGREHY